MHQGLHAEEGLLRLLRILHGPVGGLFSGPQHEPVHHQRQSSCLHALRQVGLPPEDEGLQWASCWRPLSRLSEPPYKVSTSTSPPKAVCLAAPVLHAVVLGLCPVLKAQLAPSMTRPALVVETKQSSRASFHSLLVPPSWCFAFSPGKHSVFVPPQPLQTTSHYDQLQINIACRKR